MSRYFFSAKAMMILLPFWGIPLAYLLVLQFWKAVDTDMLSLIQGETTETKLEAHELITRELSKWVFIKCELPPKHLGDYEAIQRKIESHIIQEDVPLRLAPKMVNEQMLDTIQDHALPLFFPAWLQNAQERYSSATKEQTFESYIAYESVQELDRFLDSADSLAYASIEEDPLLLLPKALKRMISESETSEANTLVIRAKFSLDPFSSKDQTTLIRSLVELRERLRHDYPYCELDWTGPFLIAKESKESIQSNVTWLNALSVILVTCLLLYIFRRLQTCLYLLLPVVSAILWGLSAVMYFYGSIHVMTLLLGSVIIGLSVDYGIHYLCKASQEGLSVSQVRAAVLRPLVLGWGSSCVGFMVLLFTPMLSLRQAGAMIPIGLTASLVTVLLIYPVMAGLHSRRIEVYSRVLPYKTRHALLVVALLACFTGIITLFLSDAKIHADIDQYRVDTQAQQSLDKLLNNENQSPLVYAIATEPYEAFSKLASLPTAEGLVSVFDLPSDNLNIRKFGVEPFLKEWESAMHESGYDVEAFNGFERQLRAYFAQSPQPAFNNAINTLYEANSQLLNNSLLHISDGFVVLTRAADLEHSESLPRGTHVYSGKNEINTALNRYLEHLLEMIWIGGIAIVIVVLFTLKSARALIVLGIPVLSLLPVFALSYWTNDALGLTAYVALALGFCTVLDYSAFCVLGNRTSSITSIRVSTATTLLVFAILALCVVPALSQMGYLVSTVVLTGWALCECYLGYRSNDDRK